MKFKMPEPIIVNGLLKTPMYTEAQLKQALRDVLEEAVQEFSERERYHTHEVRICVQALRSMIGEIN